MDNANNDAASEKIMVAARDAGSVQKGFRYAVTEVGERWYRVRPLFAAEPFANTFTREVFGG